VEKELGVDKLEISKRFTEPRQEGNKRRILERLDSDVQKLRNLQITVEDLKRKVEITEKSKKGEGIEVENVKGQLEEADEAIAKGSLSSDFTSFSIFLSLLRDNDLPSVETPKMRCFSWVQLSPT
ncbi:unnamed protein product, partial [Prunus brigantina]